MLEPALRTPGGRSRTNLTVSDQPAVGVTADEVFADWLGRFSDAVESEAALCPARVLGEGGSLIDCPPYSRFLALQITADLRGTSTQV